jgi:hypothetical protein
LDLLPLEQRRPAAADCRTFHEPEPSGRGGLAFLVGDVAAWLGDEKPAAWS